MARQAKQSHDTAEDRLTGDGVHSLGLYRILSADLYLGFPEPNMSKMISRVGVNIEFLAPTRFVERSRDWTGSGLQSPPRISAVQDKAEIQAKRHGPFYRSGQSLSFLIDLGRIFVDGEKLFLETSSQFVDERGTFQYFHSFNVTGKHVAKMSLSVDFLRPPNGGCDYDFRTDSLSPWGAPETLSGCVSNLGTEFLVVKEEPTPGRHRITWL